MGRQFFNLFTGLCFLGIKVIIPLLWVIIDYPLCMHGLKHLEDGKICPSRILCKTPAINHPFLGFYLGAWI